MIRSFANIYKLSLARFKNKNHNPRKFPLLSYRNMNLLNDNLALLKKSKLKKMEKSSQVLLAPLLTDSKAKRKNPQRSSFQTKSRTALGILSEESTSLLGKNHKLPKRYQNLLQKGKEKQLSRRNLLRWAKLIAWRLPQLSKEKELLSLKQKPRNKFFFLRQSKSQWTLQRWWTTSINNTNNYSRKLKADAMRSLYLILTWIPIKICLNSWRLLKE